MAASAPRDGGGGPWLTIARRGLILLNRAAYLALHGPAAVELLFDTRERILALRPVAPTVEHAYPVRATTDTHTGSFVISAFACLNHYRIDRSVTTRYPAYLDGDLLCANLDNPDTRRNDERR